MSDLAACATCHDCGRVFFTAVHRSIRWGWFVDNWADTRPHYDAGKVYWLCNACRPERGGIGAGGPLVRSPLRPTGRA